MSDYTELCEDLRSYTYWLGQSGNESRDLHPPIADLAADAIEALQVEIAKRDKTFAELKPAVERLDRVFKAMCGVVCSHCVNAQCYVRGGTKDCSPLLRGGPGKNQSNHEMTEKVPQVPNESSCEGGEKEA